MPRRVGVSLRSQPPAQTAPALLSEQPASRDEDGDANNGAAAFERTRPGLFQLRRGNSQNSVAIRVKETVGIEDEVRKAFCVDRVKRSTQRNAFAIPAFAKVIFAIWPEVFLV